MNCAADGCNETGRVAIGNNNLPVWFCKDHYEVFNDLYEPEREPVTA